MGSVETRRPPEAGASRTDFDAHTDFDVHNTHVGLCGWVQLSRPILAMLVAPGWAQDLTSLAWLELTCHAHTHVPHKQQ